MAKEIHQISDLTMIRDIARVFNELLRLSTLAEKQHRIRRWVIADFKKNTTKIPLTKNEKQKLGGMPTAVARETSSFATLMTMPSTR